MFAGIAIFASARSNTSGEVNDSVNFSVLNEDDTLTPSGISKTNRTKVG